MDHMNKSLRQPDIIKVRSNYIEIVEKGKW